MTRFLASVRDPAEAEIVLTAGADIVDLKDPAKGALGAVAPDVILSCVATVAGRVPVSATVGDVPMEPEVMAKAVAAAASLGVDTVKLGIAPGGDPDACLDALRAQVISAELILVFFADAIPDLDPVAAAQASGAVGVMLDTAGKVSGPLPDHMSLTEIRDFIRAARIAGLMAGVAGALRESHVAPLLALGPDVIGFRGALCRDNGRTNALDPAACHRIRSLISMPRDREEACFQEPSAPALC